MARSCARSRGTGRSPSPSTPRGATTRKASSVRAPRRRAPRPASAGAAPYQHQLSPPPHEDLVRGELSQGLGSGLACEACAPERVPSAHGRCATSRSSTTRCSWWGTARSRESFIGSCAIVGEPTGASRRAQGLLESRAIAPFAANDRLTLLPLAHLHFACSAAHPVPAASFSPGLHPDQAARRGARAVRHRPPARVGVRLRQRAAGGRGVSRRASPRGVRARPRLASDPAAKTLRRAAPALSLPQLSNTSLMRRRRLPPQVCGECGLLSSSSYALGPYRRWPAYKADGVPVGESFCSTPACRAAREAAASLTAAGSAVSSDT